jgi:hypothetical protein
MRAAPLETECGAESGAPEGEAAECTKPDPDGIQAGVAGRRRRWRRRRRRGDSGSSTGILIDSKRWCYGRRGERQNCTAPTAKRVNIFLMMFTSLVVLITTVVHEPHDRHS